MADPFNMQFGGRTVGEIENNAFVYANTGLNTEAGVIARINGVDELTTKDLTVQNEPFMPKGWSILPGSLHSFSPAADNTTDHEFDIDLSQLANSENLMFRITRFGKRNSSGGNAQKFSYSLLVHVTTDVGGNVSVDWSRQIEDQNCIVTSVDVIPNGATGSNLNIKFSTTNPIFGGGTGVTEFQSMQETDFR